MKACTSALLSDLALAAITRSPCSAALSSCRRMCRCLGCSEGQLPSWRPILAIPWSQISANYNSMPRASDFHAREEADQFQHRKPIEYLLVCNQSWGFSLYIGCNKPDESIEGLGSHAHHGG